MVILIITQKINTDGFTKRITMRIMLIIKMMTMMIIRIVIRIRICHCDYHTNNGHHLIEWCNNIKWT